MAKKAGSARTAAPRSPSRRAGRTRKTARTGFSPEQTLSERPFSLKAQQREAASMTSPKPSPKRMTASPSDSKLGYQRPVITGPYWSDATVAWRIEFYQHHPKRASLSRGSSFYCSEQADAERLYAAASKVKTWAQWLALRTVAVELAVGRRDGFLYRVMAGEREVFIEQKAR
jgi:hypothetical protein